MIAGRRFRMQNLTWIVLALLGMSIVGVLGAAAAALVIRSTLPGSGGMPPAVDDPTPIVTLTPAEGSISGRVWHDLCASGLEGQSPPKSAPEGCLTSTSGGYSANGVMEAHEPGLSGVTVRLGAGLCPSTGLTTAVTGSDGSFQFTGLTEGAYCVSIDPASPQHFSHLVPGMWTFPQGIGSEGVAAVSLSLMANEMRRDVNFGWDHRYLPAPVPGPTNTPGSTACLNRATFISDVTIVDNANIQPGLSFEKIWRLQNTGTCTWTTEYDMVFIGGSRMNAPSSIPLAKSVPPGSMIDLRVVLTAPTANGVYRGDWQLRTAENLLFGVGDRGDRSFWVQIVVGPSDGAVRGAWRGEYFSNRELKGSPVLVRNDAVIDFDWKRGSPAQSVPVDNFSVRWMGTGDFEAATYRFKALADDGVRLWVDNVLVIDAWADGSAREITRDVALTKGAHSLKLEYYERGGDARARLRWERLDSPSFPDWKGEYFSNRDLSGKPTLVRNDAAIDFRWESKSPAVGLPEDNFSVRWTRKLTFEPGTYRFSARSDDGIRIFVDGTRILNEWHDGSGKTVYTAERELSGKHTIVVEYYERGGKADVKVWWERLTPTEPPPTITPTEPPPTVTPTDPPPTITPTEPPPTETPPPTQEPETVFSFTDRACSATWYTGSGGIPCPGAETDPLGYVLKVDGARLETGSAASATALITHPERTDNGWIIGIFPMHTVSAGDRFRVRTGCLEGHSDCNVTFKLGYWLDLEPQHTLSWEIEPLVTWSETHDGELTAIDFDLSRLAGQSVAFILTVQANGSSDGDAAVWLRPRIVH